MFAFAIATISMAQNPKMMVAIQKNIAIMDTAKTQAGMQQAINGLDRIAAAEKSEWLPLYYSALYNTLMGIAEKKDNKKDDIYEKALMVAEQANVVNPNNSEIYALKAFVLQMQLQINPMIRGKKYGMMATIELDKAIELDPNNPRPYYLRGTSLFYTPSMFGGGKDKAKPILETAMAKYAAFKPATAISPNWGADRTKKMLDQCK
jgi:tetratricopeptide (TPR) repeat protein